MDVFHDAERLPRALDAPVVAIGNFDGVHRGHQRILAATVEAARASGGEPVALTFDPLPARVIAPESAPPAIQSLARRIECIEACGIGVAVVQPFTAEFAARSPESFIADVLVRGLGARHIVVGYDFTYGRRREGTVETLGAASFATTVVPAVTVDGTVVSSTRIRQLVGEGALAEAAELLGRPFEVAGTVVPGRGRGRTIGVPTANVAPEQELLPPRGVYAATVTLDGARHVAAVNVGVAPTFERDGTLTVEAHVLDFSGDLLGRGLSLEMRERLRDERRFASADELVAQIRRDIALARERLS